MKNQSRCSKLKKSKKKKKRKKQNKNLLLQAWVNYSIPKKVKCKYKELFEATHVEKYCKFF